MGVKIAAPTPEKAVEMPMARPFFLWNQLLMSMGSGAKNRNALPKPMTTASTYHIQGSVNCDISMKPPASRMAATVIRTLMFLVGSQRPTSGIVAAVAHAWMVM